MADGATRHISNAIAKQVIALVDSRCGPDGVERALALAGEQRSRQELEDLTAWSSWTEGRRLLESCATVLGGSSVLRDVAHSWVRDDTTGEVVTLLQSLGSPAEVLRFVAEAAAKFSPVVRMQPIEVHTNAGLVAAEALPGFERFAELCDYTAGLLSIGPMLFGLEAAQVVEERCQLRGDDRCVYRVTWDDRAVDEGTTEQFLRTELASLTTRFDEFKATASDLVSGDDVETLLSKITARAATAVRAPAYLLAARLSDDSPLQIHHQGVAPDELDSLVLEILADVPDDRGGSRLIVDVRSGRHEYGKLAALIAPGARFFPEERSVLLSYAGLAAAALDAAVALETAKRESSTAQALLALSHELAGVCTPAETAQRLVEATRGVVSCDHASVSLFDEESATLHNVATSGFPPAMDQYLRGLAVSVEDTSELPRLLALPEPVLLDPETADPYIRRVLEALGAELAIAVPLVGHDRVYGFLTVGVTSKPERLRSAADLLVRLRGLGDQAVAALRNAELVEHIRHQALHDALTGLPNRTLLEDRVDQALQQRRHRAGGVCLLFIDLDRFKLINDTLGHDAGDAVICQVAVRLAGCLRSGDTLARLGGDEFAVVLTDARGSAEGADVAQRMMDALAHPIMLAGKELFVSCSVGVVAAPEHGDEYVILLRHADAAMYEAKARGRNTFVVHTVRAPEDPSDMLDLESALHRAVANDELRVFYQPQVDAQTGVPVAVEALVRWEHPTLGLLSPATFLPIAEESGLIVQMDGWVRRRALTQIRAWADAGHPLRLALNLSTRELRDPDLARSIAADIRRAGLDPEQIELEITDRIVLDDEELAAVIRRLRHVGVRLAIDDFGTGTSVLRRLTDYEFHTLKIDRSFMRQIDPVRDEAPVIRALLSLAHSFGLEVVAEGVETPAQASALRRLGCDLIQGFLFGRPVDAETFEQSFFGADVVPVS